MMLEIIDTGRVIRAETDFDLLNHLNVYVERCEGRRDALRSIFNGESILVTKARMTGVTTLFAYVAACIIEYTKEKPLILGGNYSVEYHINNLISEYLMDHGWKKYPYCGVVIIDEASFIQYSAIEQKLRGFHSPSQFIVSGTPTLKGPIDSAYHHFYDRQQGCLFGINTYKFKHFTARSEDISVVRRLMSK